jgi:biopolymer transport protein ExbD
MIFSHKQTESLDTEINIVPIIDCMVMLICFLLFTATFTQLVYIEAKLASNTAAAADKSRAEFDQFRLVIELHDNHLRLKTTGSAIKKNLDETIALKGTDYSILHQKIVELKTMYPDRYSADLELKGGKNFPYENVLAVIDVLHHLNDDEFSQVKISQKRAGKVQLSSGEEEKKIQPEMLQLAQALLSNETAKNADSKLLFPDIALIGMD